MTVLADIARVVYGALTLLYPRDFRRAYSREMRQVFAASLDESAQRGMCGQLSCLGQAVMDVVGSATAERTYRVMEAGEVWQRIVPGALGLGVLAGYAHARSDDDMLLIALVVGLPFVYGVFRPLAAWVPALVIGIAVIGVQMVSQGVVPARVTGGDVDHILLLPLLIAPGAALIGAVVRSAVVRPLLAH